MAFRALRTAAFRNLADAEVDTLSKDVFLIGENGQGKTNFLEALYYCSYASSFRGSRDGDLVKTGEKDCAVQAQIDFPVHGAPETGSPFPGEVSVVYKDGKKTISLDGKRIADRKELLQVAPCIVFCHEDMDFVSGAPENRRRFFDQTRSLTDPVYLDDLRNYRKVLKSKNMLLRELRAAGRGIEHEAGAVLDALDPQLVRYGLSLMEKRRETARDFALVFEPLYREISGLDGVTVRYAPSWKGDDAGALEAALAEKREIDCSFGVSLSGPHRDRYVFERKGREFAGRASTGQRRLLALLLRAAQAREFSSKAGRDPVLLLDDVLLELDREKRRRFLGIMPRYDQAFYTFLPGEPFDWYRKDDALVYTVEAGRLIKEAA